MNGCKPCNTPIPIHFFNDKPDNPCSNENATTYRTIFGALQWRRWIHQQKSIILPHHKWHIPPKIMFLYSSTKWCNKKKTPPYNRSSHLPNTYASFPTKFLSFAFAIVVYLINRLPSQNLQNKTPFECLFNQPFDYKPLKKICYVCYRLLKQYNSHKLQPKNSQCIFLGYPLDYKGYLCYNMTIGKFFISRHVIFDEFFLSLLNNPIKQHHKR